MSGTTPTLGFAGLTHLGIVSSAAAAAKGMRTVAFDPDAALVARLGRGEPPIHEPGLADLVAASGERLHYTSTVAELGRCDLIYVCPELIIFWIWSSLARTSSGCTGTLPSRSHSTAAATDPRTEAITVFLVETIASIA